MKVFINTPGDVVRPGVYAIKQAPPRVIRGISMGYIGYVGRFAWGPANVGYLPNSSDDLLATYEPKGSPRTSTGYYGLMQRIGATWFIVRVVPGTAGIAAPTGVSLATVGTAGSTSYTFGVTAVNITGETMVGQQVTITTGNSTLTSGNYITVSWSAVPGATNYNIYLLATSGAAALGKVGTVASPTVTYNDQAMTATTAAPTANTTGYQQAFLQLTGNAGAFLNLTALYPGALGNSIQLTIQAATNGSANARDLVVSLTNATTKTTKEQFRNVAFGQAITLFASTTTLTPPAGAIQSRLLSAISFSGATMNQWPANGTYNLSNGSDGIAAVAADYTNAVDQLAAPGGSSGAQDNVRIVVSDDMGDTLRPAVNAYITGHCVTYQNRICWLQGSQSDTWTTVKTNAALNINERVNYCANWVQVYDDYGNLQATPAATIAASMRNQLNVTDSIGRRNDNTLKYLVNVKGTVQNFTPLQDQIQDDATTLGIQFVILLPTGKYAFNHGRTTNNAAGQPISWECEVWYNDYLAMTLIPALGFAVNGPNDIDENNTIKGMVIQFMTEEARLRHVVQKPDPNNPTQKLPAFSVDIDSVNTFSTQANGDFYIQIDGGFPGLRERIYLLQNVGSTVAVRSTQT